MFPTTRYPTDRGEPRTERNDAPFAPAIGVAAGIAAFRGPALRFGPAERRGTARARRRGLSPGD